MEEAAPPEIVLVAHYNLARVQELLADDPSLLNVLYAPWAETPLGAASHVGNRPIAEYLLAQGAPLTIPTAAMLGRREDVERFLALDPSQANATGAHGISLLYHTAFSGDVALAEAIVAAGGKTDSAGHALHAAVSKGHTAMTAWLLAQGADPNVTDYQGRTPLAAARAAELDEIAGLLAQAGGRETA